MLGRSGRSAWFASPGFCGGGGGGVSNAWLGRLLFDARLLLQLVRLLLLLDARLRLLLVRLLLLLDARLRLQRGSSGVGLLLHAGLLLLLDACLLLLRCCSCSSEGSVFIAPMRTLSSRCCFNF